MTCHSRKVRRTLRVIIVAALGFAIIAGTPVAPAHAERPHPHSWSIVPSEKAPGASAHVRLDHDEAVSSPEIGEWAVAVQRGKIPRVSMAVREEYDG